MRLVWFLFGACFVAAGCGFSIAGGDDAGGLVGPHDWALEGVAPDGQHLLVSTLFGGVASGCTRFDGWEVEETDNVVEITARLWRRRAPSDCTDEGVVELLQVDLDAPLGDRVLVGCGQDDCRATVTEDSPLSVGQVVATMDAFAVVGPRTFEAYDSDGDLVAAIPGGSSGEVFALQGDVVVRTDGVETVAVDLLSGEELWRRPGWVTAAASNVVYVCRGQDSDGLAAIDARTGLDLWATDLACEPLVSHGELVTIISHDINVDGGHLTVIVNATTGELVSSKPLFDGYDDQVGGFNGAIAVDSGTLVAGQQAHLVILDQHGVELARQPRSLGNPFGQADGVAILGNHDRAIGFDSETRSELWVLDGNAFSNIAVADGSVWLLGRSEGTVSLLNPRTGNSIWTTHIGLTSSFDVAADSDTTYVLTTQAVVAIDNYTGEIRWAHHRPYSTGD